MSASCISFVTGCATQAVAAAPVPQSGEACTDAEARDKKYATETHVDKIDSYTFLSSSTEKLSKEWEVYVGRVTTTKGSTLTQLVARYRAPDWFFIEDGESLVMMIDGQRVGFSGDGSSDSRHVVRGGVTESASWIVTRAQLWNLANAKEVTIRIRGRNQGYADLNVPKNVLCSIRRFALELP